MIQWSSYKDPLALCAPICDKIKYDLPYKGTEGERGALGVDIKM